MGIITRALKERAIYWEPDRQTSTGQWTYKPPVEIACRWDEGMVAVRDENGEVVTYEAAVMVDRDLHLHGRLFLGRIKDLNGPFQFPTRTRSVRRIVRNPNLRATEFFRQVYL